MAERTWIQQIVERVVSQVLESHVTFLKDDLVRRVMQELQPVLGAAPDGNPNNLLRSISAIHKASTQKDILTALLENTEPHSGRAALFVVKPGGVSGWQGRAFVSNDSIKNFPLDVSTGMAAKALEKQEGVAGAAPELDSNFVSTFGAPADDKVILLPLVVKEKPAALLYADGGIQAGGPLDAAALEILALSASTWLEVVSLRRGAAHETLVPEKAEAASAAVVATAPAPAPAVQAAAAAAAIPEPQVPAEEKELHKKAQRFAKLLVDEIKLYNQAKVNEGRKHKDLYDRLKDDIEKSRAIYKKRYAGTAAEPSDYFREALIRILADNDSSLLGANFPR
jgi:hypothetical protein